MLLAYDEELPPEDCTEGADESDDGGARRMLRSHAAAVAAAAGTGGNGAGFKRAAIQVCAMRLLLHIQPRLHLQYDSHMLLMSMSAKQAQACTGDFHNRGLQG